MHVTRRTREQATAAEPAPDPRSGDTAPDPIDRRRGSSSAAGRGEGEAAAAGGTGPLAPLYARHPPARGRTPPPRPALLAAPRSPRRFARHRTAGQELVRVRPGDPEPAG